jgi:uncharacterized protein YaeQ
LGATTTLYRGQITVADTDRQRYLTLKPSTARHRSETLDRLVLRLLALALFPAPALRFRAGVSAGDEPDLAGHTEDGRISHWIDVGTPALERLQAASRRDRQIGVLTHSGLLERWRRQHGGRLALDPHWEVWCIEADLVQALGADLKPRLHWELTLAGGVLYLSSGTATLSSELQRITA